MKKPHDDDLFKDSVMTFGEHLEELRRCLWKAVIGLVVGFLIGLYLAAWVVDFIQTPLELALQRYYLDIAEDEYREINPRYTAEELAIITERRMTFHREYIQPNRVLTNLRKAYPDLADGVQLSAEMISADDVPDFPALVGAIAGKQGVAGRLWSRLSDDERATIESIAGADRPVENDKEKAVVALNRLLGDRGLYDEESFRDIVADLDPATSEQVGRIAALQPDELRNLNWRLLHAALPKMIAPPHPVLVELELWKPIENDPRTRSKSLGMPEPFMIWLKAAFISGFVISSPWVFYQIWTFVAAGLYPQEKKYVHVFMPFSIALFLLGAGVAFFFVFEPVLNFFLSFNRSLNIDSEPRISEWLSFVMFLPIGFGLAFQLPLVMLFLERIHVMSVASYLKQWRVAVLVIWVLAALLTPADPTSIFFLAVPLMFLYFGGVLLCKWWPSKK